MKKYMIITIISALLVSAAVLVGFPLYKSWALTSNCLREDKVERLGDEHGWYPCGWQFSVMHLGYDDTDPPSGCDCDHEGPYSVRILITDRGDPNTIHKDMNCGGGGDVELCEDTNKTQYCMHAHVPPGDYQFKFICSEGEETDWKYLNTLNSTCGDEWTTRAYCYTPP